MEATTKLYTADEIGNEILKSGIGYYEFIIKNFYRINSNLGSLESVIDKVKSWFEKQVIEEIQHVGIVKIMIPLDSDIGYSVKAGVEKKFFNVYSLESFHPYPSILPTISFFASKSEKILLGRSLRNGIYLHSEVIEKYMDFIQNDPEAKNNAMSFFENLKQQSNAK